MRRKVYIIHSLADEYVASAICRSFEEVKMKCSGLESATPRAAERALAKLIDDSDIVVLILSAAINDSVQVKLEVERALKANKIIIPFRIDTTPLPKYIEFYLSTAHWLDASTPQLDQHLMQLVATAQHFLYTKKEDGRASIFPRKRRSKKAVAAMIFGILSPIIGGVIFGLLAIILGIVELRAIAKGRSTIAGRRFAQVGILFGGIGIVLTVYLMVFHPDILTDGVNNLIDMVDRSLRPDPLGLRR